MIPYLNIVLQIALCMSEKLTWGLVVGHRVADHCTAWLKFYGRLQHLRFTLEFLTAVKNRCLDVFEQKCAQNLVAAVPSNSASFVPIIREICSIFNVTDIFFSHGLEISEPQAIEAANFAKSNNILRIAKDTSTFHSVNKALRTLFGVCKMSVVRRFKRIPTFQLLWDEYDGYSIPCCVEFNKFFT